MVLKAAAEIRDDFSADAPTMHRSIPKSWGLAALQTPVLSKALTPLRHAVELGPKFRCYAIYA
jgi:hypothetical protein